MQHRKCSINAFVSVTSGADEPVYPAGIAHTANTAAFFQPVQVRHRFSGGEPIIRFPDRPAEQRGKAIDGGARCGAERLQLLQLGGVIGGKLIKPRVKALKWLVVRRQHQHIIRDRAQYLMRTVSLLRSTT